MKYLTLAVSGMLMLSSTVAAQPLAHHHKRLHAHHKRRIVIETVYETNWHTVWVPCPTDSPKADAAGPQEPAYTGQAEPPYSPPEQAAQPASQYPNVEAGKPVLVDAPPYTPPAAPSPTYVAPPKEVAHVAPVPTKRPHHRPSNPTPVPAPAPVPVAAPAPPPPQKEDSGSSGKSSYGGKNGEATYYDPSIGAGSCGIVPPAGMAVCAVSHELFDTYSNAGNPNRSRMCGKMIEITNESDPSKTATCMALDKCPGCNKNGLDLDQATFEKLAPSGQGRCNIVWKYKDWDETGSALTENFQLSS